MSWASGEHPEMDQDQQLAMCYSTYRGSKSKSITKDELMAELMFEKSRLMKLVKAERLEQPTDYVTDEDDNEYDANLEIDSEA
jgi:hypothetical protein